MILFQFSLGLLFILFYNQYSTNNNNNKCLENLNEKFMIPSECLMDQSLHELIIKNEIKHLNAFIINNNRLILNLELNECLNSRMFHCIHENNYILTKDCLIVKFFDVEKKISVEKEIKNKNDICFFIKLLKR